MRRGPLQGSRSQSISALSPRSAPSRMDCTRERLGMFARSRHRSRGIGDAGLQSHVFTVLREPRRRKERRRERHSELGSNALSVCCVLSFGSGNPTSKVASRGCILDARLETGADQLIRCTTSTEIPCTVQPDEGVVSRRQTAAPKFSGSPRQRFLKCSPFRIRRQP